MKLVLFTNRVFKNYYNANSFKRRSTFTGYGCKEISFKLKQGKMNLFLKILENWKI